MGFEKVIDMRQTADSDKSPKSKLGDVLESSNDLYEERHPQDSTRSLFASDRGTPTWAKPLSYIFSAGVGICLISIAVLGVFFHELVGVQGNQILSPLLAAVGLVPVIGVFLLEFAHARALAGYRYARDRSSIGAQAMMGVVAFLVLEFVHPLLGIAIPIGVIFSYGVVKFFSRYSIREPLWDFIPAEAISILAGRDNIGMKLATYSAQDHPLMHGFRKAIVWLTLLLTFAIASWLSAIEVLSTAAIASSALISFWCVENISKFFVLKAMDDPLLVDLAQSVVRHKPAPELNESGDRILSSGLRVTGLNVETQNGEPLLNNIEFNISPGEVIGVLGPPGAGKTTLLRALCSPFDLSGLDVRGYVAYSDVDLWERQISSQSVPAVYLPTTPLMLPTSGQNNLSLFQGRMIQDRSHRLLEQLVFATDIVEKLCNSPDATTLSSSEQKALAFSRAFLLSPNLYLMDRPEDGASEKLVTALVGRLKHECRAGRSFMMVTENRALLDICDKLLMLQDGQIIDFGPAQEIRDRQSSGWARFVGARALDTEENLETWVRSHFKRDGDEVNRRKACVVAAELLAFSCQSAESISDQTVSFEFKHFEGHCLIKMSDRDAPVSTGVLKRAKDEAKDESKKGHFTPLGSVLRVSASLEATVEFDHRVLLAQIDTYDPRKSGGKPPAAYLDQMETTKASEHADKSA